ncbi:hypothetical protein FHS39_001225 [Streptomyces olivoverticillatus]|uniref:Gram-positive cocci surface proteins LPxTG domain-containing protein n=1 Tax=Streptomyces olivoverticillatus TaxID=66427 RepID=A0A7W7LLH8_9ACTN|nr:hypothetical protein [Streptomyces olivoverticillatus]MBB4892214.1 hypothetical protein [Streptomyces olivoverticillatus]
MSPTCFPGPVRRTLFLAAAACTLAAAPVPRAPAPASALARTQPPHCGDAHSADFPIASRLSGGPGAYERGGAPAAWQLELRNGTEAECRAVHPVAVLADSGRALQPGQIHLDFYDSGASRWRPVSFERTEEAENVGVLDGRAPDFPGFVVPAHGTVVVPLRLAFGGDAPEGAVTANVTAVQRRGADGAWVGESDDYAFAVGGRPGTVPSAAPSASPAEGAGRPGALADTGDTQPLFGIGTAACALLVAGAALVAGARRLRR